MCKFAAMVEPEIRAYYEQNAERDRLASGARRVEFLRVCELALLDLAQRLDDAPRRDQVLALLRLLETEPSLLGASQNLVAIARVPALPDPRNPMTRRRSPKSATISIRPPRART
jgi:hypothetical protein